MISDLEITTRLAVAAILGSLIGFERERLLWAAGIRTHMLVCVGACLLMIVSAYGFEHALAMPHVVLDPSRIAAQVVTGIGFLGAGSIILSKGERVRGLTTAASIWAVAALGLAAGGGLYFASVVSTGIILVILAGIKPIEEAYRARIQSCVLEIKADRDALATVELKKLLSVRSAQMKQVLIQDLDQSGQQTVRVHLVRVSRNDIRLGVARLKSAPGILSVALVGRRRAHGAAGD